MGHKVEKITIKGIPKSVVIASSGGGDYPSFCAICCILDIGGKLIFAIGTAFSPVDAVMAVALIQSEISDGNEELIELIGFYSGNEFRFRQVKAKGLSVGRDEEDK